MHLPVGAHRVGAGVAVVQRGNLLLVRRRDNGQWDVPGGGVNPGKEVLAAALRELREETGLSAPEASLLAVFSGPDHAHTYPDGNRVEWVTVLYRADLTPGGATPNTCAGDDAAEVRWWPLTALPDEVGPATLAYFRALTAPVVSKQVHL